MSRTKKILLWFARGAGIVFILTVVALLLGSWYINTEPAQKRIRALVAEQVGDIVTFQRVGLSLFPLPHVTFRQVGFAIPDTAAGSVDSASIYPELLPLLTGKVRIAKVRFEKPDITVELSGKPKQGRAKGKPTSPAETRADIASVMASIRSLAPDLAGVVHQGRLVVRMNKRDVASIHDLNARIALVPKGLDITITADTQGWERISASGKFYTEENSLMVKDLSVSGGRSSVSVVSVRLRWEKTPYLEISSGKADLVLDDIFKRRSSFEGLRDLLSDVKNLKGTIKLATMNLSGPLLQRDKWKMEATGNVEGIAVDSEQLPGPVSVARGQFKATMKTVALSNVQAAVLDSSVTASVELSGSVQAIRAADVSLNGSIGPETVQWASRTFNLPPELTVRAPLSISNAHVVWQTGSNLSVTGTVVIHNGPTISVDLSRDTKDLAIKRLTIGDEGSHADIALTYGKNRLDFSFTGSLNEKTLNRMFERTSVRHGSIQGDLRAHVQLDRPRESTAHGRVEGADLIVPLGMKVPMKVDRAVLHADDKTFTVESAAFTWGENHLALKGNVKASEEGFRVDMDLSTDGIKVETLQQALATEKKPSPPQQTERSEKRSGSVLMQGTIRFSTKYITYGRYTASPVRADIVLDREGVHVAVIEAALCGISLPGNVSIIDKDIGLDFKLASTRQQLEPPLTCLSGNDSRISGMFDLKAEVNARGKPKALVRALQGRVEFATTDGHIYSHPLLAKILSVLNVTELLRGKLPDFKTKGFDYNAITIKGDLRDGKFMLQEAVVNGTTLDIVGQGDIDLAKNTINLTVLVAPFKTVDYLVSKIPGINYILKGTLISIPLTVTGRLADPDVKVISPSAVGEGVLGIMKRTLELPVKVIEPVLPREKKKRGDNK